MIRLRPKKLTFNRETIKVLDSHQLSHVYSGISIGVATQPAPLMPGTALGCEDTCGAAA